MNQLKNFYKNKKIFITGHTGFKGAWLTSTLIEFDPTSWDIQLKMREQRSIKAFVTTMKFKTYTLIYLTIKLQKKTIKI